MALTEQPQAISDTTERVLERIAIDRPYFALEEVEEIGPGMATAVVPLQLPRRGERGPIEAAQAARHMAILGSCAAALAREDDAVHHYLAVEASYMRSAGAPDRVGDGHLRANATASWLDRRTARAMVVLGTEAGEALTMLDVRFAVMTPRMFGRLNPPVVHDLTQLTSEPSEWNPFETGTVTATSSGLRLDCGPVPAAACAGHFPDYPAAPVAVLMGELCRTAAEALALRLGGSTNYSIDAGHVTASRLAGAGQQLMLEASYERGVGSQHEMRGTATADGEPVGEVRVRMSSPAEVADEQSC